MLHLIYILAFTVIAFLAISNLLKSLISVSMDSQRGYRAASQPNSRASNLRPLHPELLDETGKPVNEPLLVMRSVTVEDARQQLDAIYNSSPSQPKEIKETDEEN
jgi:hypothetical protein